MIPEKVETKGDPWQMWDQLDGWRVTWKTLPKPRLMLRHTDPLSGEIHQDT